jgi:hypothetical protein
MERRFVAEPFLRWKGLERPAIIVTDVQPKSSSFSTRPHIALTRATTAARFVVTAEATAALAI